MASKRYFIACLALAALVLAGCSSDSPPAAAPTPEASPTPEPTCPLTDLKPDEGVDVTRPAVAVKIENNPVAYPLSGLEKAEIVFEEEVEGGATRFMAIFHCTDAAKAGPVRSSRVVDPAIMSPITRILAAAGGNDLVRRALDEGHISIVDEDGAGAAMRRIDRPGIAIEHTLYGNTAKLRKVGSKSFHKPPTEDLFAFGEPLPGGKKAKTVTLDFGSDSTIDWKWNGSAWQRSQFGELFVAESGKKITADNIIIEQHTVNNSTTIVDVAGNPSIEIADVTGSGKAILFRDGRAFVGRWVRKNLKSPVEYQTKDGDILTLKPGNTWVELVPGNKGQIKGSVAFKK